MKTHTCSIPGCNLLLPEHQLMCRRHWKRVPYRLRADVWAAWEQYRSGEMGIEDLRRVQHMATDAVIAAEEKAAEAKGGAQ